MIALSVAAAAGVICRSMENGESAPSGWAAALDAACLLQTPEVAAELQHLRAQRHEVPYVLGDSTIPKDLREQLVALLTEMLRQGVPGPSLTGGMQAQGEMEAALSVAFARKMYPAPGLFPSSAEQVHQLRACVAELKRQRESSRVDGQRLIRSEQRTAELEAVLGSHRKDDQAAIERLRADRSDRYDELAHALGRDQSGLEWGELVEIAAGLPSREKRVAELEAGLPAVQKALTQALDRVAELEAQLAGKDRPVDEDPIAFALTEAAMAVDLMPGEDVRPQVRRLRALLAGQRLTVEDPHNGPLSHSYRVGRDLPETGGAQ